MNAVVRHSYNLVRTILVTSIVIVVGAYALLYVLLNIPAVQHKVKEIGERELTTFLKTDVKIGDISIRPFDQLILYDVDIPDQQKQPLITIDKLAAGISISDLISNCRLVFSYGEIIGLHGHVTRASQDSPTNVQFIIDAFKPKGNKPPGKFDLSIHNIIIRKSELSYDVLALPRLAKFDANHIKISNLCADIDLPKLANNDFHVEVKRLSFQEHSGLDVRHFSASVVVDSTHASASNLYLSLPGTVLTPNELTVQYDSLKNIVKALKAQPINVSLRNNHVTPSDLSCFLPKLAQFKSPFLISAVVHGTPRVLHIGHLKLMSASQSIGLNANGTLYNVNDVSKLSFDFPHLKLHATATNIATITGELAHLKPDVKRIIALCGDVSVGGALVGSQRGIKFDGNIMTSLGNVNIQQGFLNKAQGGLDFGGNVNTPSFSIGRLLNQAQLLGDVALSAQFTASLRGKKLVNGKLNGTIPFVDFKGYRYQDVVADIKCLPNSIAGRLRVNDPNGKLDAEGNVLLAGIDSRVNIDLVVRQVNLSRMKLLKGNNNTVSLKMKAAFVGNKFDNATGSLNVYDVVYDAPNNKNYRLKGLNVIAHNSSVPQRLEFTSDFARGWLEGKFDFTTLVPSVKGMLSQVFPDLFGAFAKYAGHRSSNSFKFNLTVEPSNAIDNFVKLPFKLLYKTTVSGEVDVPENFMNVMVSAPYLLQGNKIIEGASVQLLYDAESQLQLHAGALYPSKTGKIALQLNALGANNRIDAHFDWKYNREHDYHGSVNTSTLLTRADNGGVKAQVDINPSQVAVNDTIWNVGQGTLCYRQNVLQVDSLNITHDSQFINIKGAVSKKPEDELMLSIKDINLDYIFETLNISNVKFGGRGTGVFYASNLLSKNPRLLTPNLHIDKMKYNDALMGDADIASHWDNENKAVAIDCNLLQSNGGLSRINGAIFPSRDSLYFDFKPQKANLAFLKPFMAAFTSDVSGCASGRAVLYGTFHDIDLYGDLYVEDFKFKLDFSNVAYSCTDSIHIKPGLIKFDNIAIRDRDRHTAKLNGWLAHDHFHAPKFQFRVTNARDLLCYDTNAMHNERWYGTIYGNGSALVDGAPGIVNIKVNMQSAARSKFTFVLSDSESANEYNFITYRDRNLLNARAHAVAKPAPVATDSLPEIVKQLTRKITKQEDSTPTKYKIDLQGDITPDLQMNLIMDPVGGDKIRATGRGNLRMTYDNSDEKLEMYGKYTLDRGNYNFTLQDIIIKDFTIKDGSTISFRGDPYKANLDIEAIYSLTANIRDLDDSFASDREINRTTVPVHALLKARGAMSHPDISFDLEFPTLTSDAYRKIKSIISTEDMMNRQIIYLLALNRFYTPEYMNNSRTGNELTSVASSTISSQLSNILGRLNENWSISPNFRTNKGDFSDMEVDLALSSQLLNNRLLFNGNFGYRDNTYNTRNSNFIGDFDIEYLLNTKGSLRLRAYNHFNDQNYFYVRNALTTQGVGIMFKYDFDKWFNFLKKKPTLGDSLWRSTRKAQTADTLKSHTNE